VLGPESHFELDSRQKVILLAMFALKKFVCSSLNKMMPLVKNMN